jgi:hypothetical protein
MALSRQADIPNAPFFSSAPNRQLWCDTESAPEAAELSKALGYTVVSCTAASIRWPAASIVYACYPLGSATGCQQAVDKVASSFHRVCLVPTW